MAANVLNPILVISSESVVVVSICMFLLALEPVGTIVVILVMVIASIFFQRILGGYSSGLGRIRQNADGLVIKKSQEALNGIKDVKVHGKSEYFSSQFSLYNAKSANASAIQYLLKQVPRMYLETLGVLVFAILTVMVMIRGEPSVQAFSALSAFALAAFRILPSANRMLSSLNSLRYADAVIDTFYNELNSSEISERTDQPKNGGRFQLPFDSKITIHNLGYQYPGAKAKALQQISLTINKGESIGVVGKSGAGKSTLADAILGLLRPQIGQILVDGVPIHEDIEKWHQKIGYVQQDIFLLDDTILQNIAFGVCENDINPDRVDEVIIEARLNEFVSTLPHGLYTKLGERGVRLSGGQKQRIGIARALYRDPTILIFDEATSALDNETESEIVSAIQRLKGDKTIIVIAHRLSTIEHCDRTVELGNAQVLKILSTNP